MMLSFRGAERQRPNPLRFALLFGHIMAEKQREDPLIIERLWRDGLFHAVVDEYNGHNNVKDLRRWQLSKDDLHSTYNLTLFVADKVKD